MSQLDDLEDIATAFKFGTAAESLCRVGGRNPHVARCGSPEHMKGANVRLYRNSKNDKLRAVCRLCERHRRRERNRRRRAATPEFRS